MTEAEEHNSTDGVTDGVTDEVTDGVTDGAATDPPAEYGDFPLKSYLGMQMTGDEPGIGIATVDIGPEHLNPNGVVHGAVLFALADTAMGKSTMSVIEEPGVFCASIEVSLRFIRPAVSGRVAATATVVKRGRSIVHLEARVVGDDDRLIATAAGTFAILGG